MVPLMANFLVTYDLNGPTPSHKQMDIHLLALGPSFLLGRILETVWYIAGPATAESLRDYIFPILSQNDLLVVSEICDVAWLNLPVDASQFTTVFQSQPLAA